MGTVACYLMVISDRGTKPVGDIPRYRRCGQLNHTFIIILPGVTITRLLTRLLLIHLLVVPPGKDNPKKLSSSCCCVLSELWQKHNSPHYEQHMPRPLRQRYNPPSSW
ncbi:hypothetical protein AVEN_182451-1, partial [Araneus ventricosus]